MTYTTEKPELARPTEVLRKEIVGWGVDLDPKDRPAVPKEKLNLETGAHWKFPERQVANYEREMSPEHKFLTPVFGTSCPPTGLSGAIRRFAFRYSEGQSAHWLLLMLADRVDVVESNVKDALRGRPDNVFAEMGLSAEVKRHGIRSRLGQGRNDLKHLPIDVVLKAGTPILLLGAAYALVSAVRKPKKKGLLALLT